MCCHLLLLLHLCTATVAAFSCVRRSLRDVTSWWSALLNRGSVDNSCIGYIRAIRIMQGLWCFVTFFFRLSHFLWCCVLHSSVDSAEEKCEEWLLVKCKRWSDSMPIIQDWFCLAGTCILGRNWSILIINAWEWLGGGGSMQVWQNVDKLTTF